MSTFVERRRPVWVSAVTLAVIFGLGVFAALVWDGVPTWHNHGPQAGPGFIRRATDPFMYYSLTIGYAVIAAGAAFLACFRFPWATINHVRFLLAGLIALMLGLVFYSSSLPTSQARAQAAWKKIEALGGKGVWDSDMVVVSLAGTGVRDDDLSLFVDFPDVEMLDLSNNPLTDDCLRHVERLNGLKTLVLAGTRVSSAAIERYRAQRPNVEVVTVLKASDPRAARSAE